MTPLGDRWTCAEQTSGVVLINTWAKSRAEAVEQELLVAYPVTVIRGLSEEGSPSWSIAMRRYQAERGRPCSPRSLKSIKGRYDLHYSLAKHAMKTS